MNAQGWHDIPLFACRPHLQGGTHASTAAGAEVPGQVDHPHSASALTTNVHRVG